MRAIASLVLCPLSQAMKNIKESSKLSTVSGLVNTEIVHAYRSGHFQNIVGKLLTYVEMLGLSEAQERATKDTIKNELWNVWDNPSHIYEVEPLFPSTPVPPQSEGVK
jgi:hypothetical protein